jgi:periplasmic protein TonB
VELKFTEATTDFWGIRTPGNGAGAAAPAAPTVGAVGAPTKSLEQKSLDSKSATPASTEPSPVANFTPPAAVQTPTVPPAAQPVAQVKEVQEAPTAPAESSPVPTVPTLSEFLTHGSNGLELKARDKQPTARIENRETATTVPAAATPVSVAPALLQVPAELDNKRSLSVALGVRQGPAPGSASIDLSADLPAEEVKIPAWLEPLARNTATVESKPAEDKTNEVGVSAASAVELHVDDKVPTSGLSEPVEAHEAAPVLAGEGHTPNFGSSLALGSNEGAARSGKGLKIALAIAALVVAAAAAWYWFVNQAPKVSAGGIGTVAESNPASIPVPENNPVGTSPRPSTTNSENLPAARALEPASATLPVARPSGTLANASAPLNNAAAKNLPDRPEEAAAREPVKKATLGKVRLAAPKITRSAPGAENGTADPGLLVNGVTSADSSGASMLANKGQGPAAPLPVGGDVKVAKLVSSVPPVYPQMARAQRIGGNVTIDALIDVTGRVTATRVLSGPSLLHDAATNAVKQWKYQPATLNGVPTATHLTVTVQFKLQ